jgi:hypothetical protein
VCGVLFSLMLTSMTLFDYDAARTWIQWLAGDIVFRELFLAPSFTSSLTHSFNLLILAASFGLLAFCMTIAQFFQT